MWSQEMLRAWLPPEADVAQARVQARPIPRDGTSFRSLLTVDDGVGLLLLLVTGTIELAQGVGPAVARVSWTDEDGNLVARVSTSTFLTAPAPNILDFDFCFALDYPAANGAVNAALFPSAGVETAPLPFLVALPGWQIRVGSFVEIEGGITLESCYATFLQVPTGGAGRNRRGEPTTTAAPLSPLTCT